MPHDGSRRRARISPKAAAILAEETKSGREHDRATRKWQRDEAKRKSLFERWGKAGALLKDAARVISEKAFAPDEYQWRENEKRELTRCLVPHATKSRNGHRPDDKGKSVQGVR